MSEGPQYGMMHNNSNQPTMPKVSPRQTEDRRVPLFLNVELVGISPLRENGGENLPTEFVDLKPPAENKLRHHNPELYQRRVLSDKACNSSPLSPLCSLSESESTVEIFKSPLPTENSSDSSDYDLTPPPAVPRSTGVSSKRVGNDVRREHSKRRRPSPRVNKCGGGGVSLWSDGCSQASTDTEDDDFEFVFSNSPNQQDRTKQYWEWCYGQDNTASRSPGQSWSAKRVAPAKGCLSHEDESSASPSARFKTPPASPQRKPKSKKTNKKVQFGLPQAVEYEINEPSRCLTILPPDVAKARYPMGEKEETAVEEEMTQETKTNSAMLAEWEEDFDEPRQRSRRHQKNRRSSSLFKPTPIKTSGEDMLPDFDELPTPSPSTEVTETLACLSMKSPKVAWKDDAQPCDHEALASLGADSKNLSVSQVVASDSEIHNTTGNCSSMDITPPQRAPMHITSNQSDTTPPPSSLGLETIHSVGGALDIDSPASGKLMVSRSPPTSMMNLCSGSEKKLNEGVENEVIRSNETIDITRLLFSNPAEDQEWSPADLFQNMALQDEHRLESILLSIDPKQKKHFVCTMDKLVVKANEIADAMPKLNARNEGEARKIVANEWLKLEIAFINQLNKGLSSTLGEMDSLLEKAKTFQAMQCLKTTKRARQLSLVQSYNNEIQELERLVAREKQRFDALEASLAPHAAIGCQGTLAIIGFRLDEFNGEILQFSFDHVVAGTETTVIFDLGEGSTKVEIKTLVETKEQSIPADHVAAKLHHYLLKKFSDGCFSLFDASNLAELQDVIASVSKQLGEIDSMVAALHAVAEDSSILVNAEMPSLEIELANGDCIVLNFGLSTSLVPQHFTLFPGDGGTATRMKIPDDVTSHNLFQKLLELCKT